MRRHRTHGIVAGLGLLALAAVLPGPVRAGENLLLNGEFSEAQLYNGWSIYFGSALDWTGQDADDCAGSGAGQLESGTTDVGTQWAEAGQCQPLDPSSWTSGAHAAFSYFSFDATAAYVQLFYYSDVLCGLGGGNYLGFASGANGATGPGWHRAAISAFTFPPATASVYVAVGAEVAQPTPMELLFDRAYFGRIPDLFSDDFETTGGTCRWSSAAP